MSASPSSVLAAAIVAAGIVGCSSTDPPPPPPPPPPTGLVIAQATPSGDGQTAIVATALPSQLRVEVTDNGSLVSGRTVAWATTSGSVTASSDTDASGIATSQWTLGQSAGLQSASATLSGAGGSPIGFTATASAGAAASIGKATPSGDGQSGIVNTDLANPLLARVADQFDNPVSGVSVMWQVTQGTATATPGSGNTASNGEASTMVALLGTAGPIIIQAMSTGLSGSPLDYSATALPLPMAVTVQLIDAPTSFSPQHITIAAGGTVTWTWSSAGVITHNVMPDATEPVISGTPVTGPNSYPFTFNTPGVYTYYCVVHGFPGGVGMFGTVTVI